MKNHLTLTLTKSILASLLACAGAVTLACSGARADERTTAVVNVAHNFVDSTGGTAFIGMIKATDGNFYGVTTEGGSTGAGVVYKYTPDYKYSVLHDFKNDHLADPPTFEGEQPGPIIQGKDGNLYGVCLGGGKDPNTPDGGGTFFKIELPSGKFTKLYDFDRGNSGDCLYPVALVQGKDGNFYGLTHDGGKNFGDGAYFRLTPTSTFTELASFNGSGTVGYRPLTQLLVGKDGNFYGIMSEGASSGGDGGGAIFKATTSGAVTLVHPFRGTDNTPRSPTTPLIQGTDGNLYGTSTYGGTQDFGTIFKCTLGGTLTVLHDFKDTNDGAEPSGGLVQGSDGNFYGGLRRGFPKDPSDPTESGPGGLYQIKASGSFTLLHKFNTAVPTAPAQAFGELVEVTKGHFASVTGGGTNSEGVIIKLTVSPAITSAATATATKGQPFTYQIKATNSPTQYGVSAIAAGLHVDTTTGLISGMSTNVGTKVMTLKALNGAGTGTRTLTLTTKAP